MVQGGVSDDCVLSGVASSSRSQWPSQQPSHHSAGPSKKKVVERRERQEEEVHESHAAPRGQKAPLPGTRPGLPPEPAPQVRLEAAA